MKKSLIALCVLALLGQGFNAQAGPPIYYKLVVPLLFDGEIPRDVELVGAAVNEITRRKIGAEVELVPLLYSPSAINQDARKLAELALLEKQGKRFDVLPDALPGAAFIPLDDLLKSYGPDIARVVGARRLESAREGGALYGLPSVSDYVASAGLTMRRDVVERLGVDLGQIHTFEDVDALFAYVSRREPQLKMVCGYRTGSSFLSRFHLAKALGGSALDQSREDADKLVNYYATDSYRETVSLFRAWHQKGYVPENLALQNLSASLLVRAGELFSYFSAYKPGIEYEESLGCGMEMVSIPLMEPVITRASLSLQRWGISETCLNPGKAMMFLNLLYSDAELVNLLIYGVEGVHYAERADGTIGYPPGVTQRTAGYQNQQPWLFPNQLLSRVWMGNDPLVWEKTRAYNDSAAFHPLLDFAFDDSAVAAEHKALSAIAARYAYGLETGQLDVDLYLTLMLTEMKAAGADRVLQAAQAQFDDWRKGALP